MKKLLIALTVFAAMLLSACSSCLGHTPTPGEAAPQAEAPDDIRSTMTMLDSLLRADQGSEFYALLANIPEKVMELDDAVRAKECFDTLQLFLNGNSERIATAINGIKDAQVADDARKLVASFSEKPVSELLASIGISVGETADDDTSNNP